MTSITAQAHGSGTGYSFVTSSEVVDIPSIGPTTVQVSNIQNNYSAVSSWCCPNPFAFNQGGTVSVSGSTLYTYAIVYRCESNYTNGNYMYRYEYNASGGYLTEAGVHSDSNRVHLGNGWYWAWGTFTSQPTASYLNTYSFYYRYSASYDKLSVAKVLLVAGDYTGLHPKYWPDVSTTRASSGVISDQTTSYTLTPSALNYSSSGALTFSESGSSTITTDMNLYSTLPALSSYTLEAWVKCTAWPTNTTTNGYGRNDKAGTIVGACYYSGTGIRWYGNTSGNAISVFGFIRGEDAYRNTTAYSLNLNQWYHLVVTNNSSAGGLNLYVNGVLYSTVATATQQYNPTLSPGNVAINRADVDGGGTAVYSYFNGNIDVVRIYNTALSSTEVQQNFNALRGRFGI
jgi:hypothetical protein